MLIQPGSDVQHGIARGNTLVEAFMIQSYSICGQVLVGGATAISTVHQRGFYRQPSRLGAVNGDGIIIPKSLTEALHTCTSFETNMLLPILSAASS